MENKDIKFLGFDDFVNENELNEATIEGYEYRFTFDGVKYKIVQGTEDKTIFGIKNKDGEWRVLTKGKLFDPANYDMNRNEMVEFLQRGIKYFNVRNPVTLDDVRGSEWEKFFEWELANKPGRLDKKYTVMKLHCGKAAAKWLTRKK